MDLIDRVDELQVIIEEAKAVPLSASAMVNRQDVLELLAQLKETIPEEVRRARWMTRDRDELLARAYKEADRIQREAHEEGERFVARDAIVQRAEREAERLIAEAKDHAVTLGIEAEEYVDQRLAAFEEWLKKTLGTVVRGREQLQADAQDLTAAQVPPPAPQAESEEDTEHEPYDARLGEPTA